METKHVIEKLKKHGCIKHPDYEVSKYRYPMLINETVFVVFHDAKTISMHLPEYVNGKLVSDYLSLCKLNRYEKIDPISVKKKEINYGRNSSLRKVKELAYTAGFAVTFRDENALDQLIEFLS